MTTWKDYMAATTARYRDLPSFITNVDERTKDKQDGAAPSDGEPTPVAPPSAPERSGASTPLIEPRETP